MITHQMLSALDEGFLEVFHERAAIREYMGKQTRNDAEHGAFNEVSALVLKSRIEKLAHKNHEKPISLPINMRAPAIDRKTIAAGDTE